MANYDGDITLTVGLEPGDVKSTAESLRKEIDSITKSASGKKLSADFKSAQAELKNLYKQSGQLLSELNKLEKKQAPTKQYEEFKNQLEKATANLENARESAEHAAKFKGIAPDSFIRANQKLQETESLVESINNKMREMENNGTAFGPSEQYSKTVEQLDKINGQMAIYKQRALESQNLTPDTSKWEIFKNSISTVSSILSKVIYVFRKIVSGAATVASKFLEIARAAGRAAVNIAKVAGQSTINGIKSLGRGLGSLVGQFGKLNFSIKRSNKSGRASNDIFKKGFMTFLRYGLGIRSVYFLFRRLRKALGEGIGNLAQYSPAFNNVISNFISALTQLKNTFATAFAPIINVVAPILTTFINLVSAAVTRIGMLIAALTGQNTFIRATAVQENFAGSLDSAAGSAGDATKAAEKYKRTIAGFDDVEILKNPDDSSGGGSGGGGGGGGGISPTDMFETVDIPESLQDWADKLKEAWANADFTGIGEAVGTKLAEALNDIPWEMVQEKANRFGTSFATFLNGALTSEITVGNEKKTLGTIIGQTVGEAINTGLELWKGFVDNIDADAIGTFIADGMNKMVITVEWETLADNIVKTANKTFQASATWASKFDFEALGTELGKAVKRIFNNFDFNIFEYNLTNFGSGLAKFVKGFFEEHPLTSVGTALGNALSAVLTGADSFIKDLPTETIGEDLAGAMNGIFSNEQLWKDLATLLSDTANGIFSLASTWSEKFDFDAMGTNIKNTITSTLNGLSWTKAKTAVNNIASGIATALNNVMTEDTFNSVGTTLANGINTTLSGINNFVSDVEWDNWGKNLGEGIDQFFADLEWDTIHVTFTNIGAALGKAVTGAAEVVDSTVSNIEWTKWARVLGASVNRFFANVNWETVGITFTNVAGAVAGAINTAVATVDTTISNIEWDKWARVLGAGVNRFFATINWDNVGITFTNVSKAVGEAINLAVGTVHEIVSKIEWKNWGKALGDSVNKFFQTINWEEVGVTFDDVVNALLDAIAEGIKTIDFKTVGANVATALTSVDWDALIKKLGETIVISAEAFQAFLDGLFGGLQDAFDQWLADKFGVDISELQPIINARNEEAQLQQEWAENFKWPWDEGFKWPWESGEPIDIDVNANAVSMSDDIPDEDKEVDNATAEATIFANLIPGEEVVLSDGTVQVVTMDDKVPSKFRKVDKLNGTLGQLDHSTLTTDQKTVPGGIIKADKATTKDVPDAQKTVTGGTVKVNKATTAGVPDAQRTVDKGTVNVETVNKSKLTPKDLSIEEMTGYLKAYEEAVGVTGKNPTEFNALIKKYLEDPKIDANSKKPSDFLAYVKKYKEGKDVEGKKSTGHTAQVDKYTEGKNAEGKNPTDFTGVIAKYKEAWNKGSGVVKEAVGFTAAVAKYVEEEKAKGKNPKDFTGILAQYKEAYNSGKPIPGKRPEDFKAYLAAYLEADGIKGKTPSDFKAKIIEYLEKGTPAGKNPTGFTGFLSKYKESGTPSGKNPGGFEAQVDDYDDDIPSWKKVLSGFWAKLTGTKAHGGAYYNGAWHAIAQYASGGAPRHGTQFVAGEAGPEVVGHIGGRTEVLNQSQLAATMYSAVINGSAKAIGALMSHLTNCTNSVNANLGYTIDSLSTQIVLMDNINSAVNTMNHSMTDIAVGKMIPNSIVVNQDTNNTLHKMADMLQYNQNNQLTRDDFADIMATLFERYMNINFYMGDEQVARHANAGNAKLNRRFDTQYG